MLMIIQPLSTLPEPFLLSDSDECFAEETKSSVVNLTTDLIQNILHGDDSQIEPFARFIFVIEMMM
jgi:hypothetical protein